MGYNISERTWEPLDNLDNAADLIREFHTNYPKKPNIIKKNFIKSGVMSQTNNRPSFRHPNSRLLQMTLPSVITLNQKSL